MVGIMNFCSYFIYSSFSVVIILQEGSQVLAMVDFRI